MGVAAGLLLGVGAFCVWWSWWVPGPRAPRRTDGWSARTQDLLVPLALTRALPVAACFASMAAALPTALVRSRARRRRVSLRDVWPEVVDHLASGVRAGLSLPEAVGQLGERGPVELREPFSRFAQDFRASGRFGDCLDALKARLADPVADRHGPRQAAEDARDVPARGREDAGRARGATVVDRERRASRCGGAVGGPRAARHQA